MGKSILLTWSNCCISTASSCRSATDSPAQQVISSMYIIRKSVAGLPVCYTILYYAIAYYTMLYCSGVPPGLSENFLVSMILTAHCSLEALLTQR